MMDDFEMLCVGVAIISGTALIVPLLILMMP
jgi:hypothetical protein